MNHLSICNFYKYEKNREYRNIITFPLHFHNLQFIWLKKFLLKRSLNVVVIVSVHLFPLSYLLVSKNVSSSLRYLRCWSLLFWGLHDIPCLKRNGISLQTQLVLETLVCSFYFFFNVLLDSQNSFVVNYWKLVNRFWFVSKGIFIFSTPFKYFKGIIILYCGHILLR